MRVGSGALVTLRRSLAHFDQIRIFLGSILLNQEWRWFIKKQNSSFAKIKSYLDTHLSVVLIASEDV
jgi:hypothetical protein